MTNMTFAQKCMGTWTSFIKKHLLTVCAWKDHDLASCCSEFVLSTACIPCWHNLLRELYQFYENQDVG